MVTVLNQTEQDWKEVLITVNDHFRGFVPVLKADGRANAPLNQFTTGHGQRWATGLPSAPSTSPPRARTARGEADVGQGREEAISERMADGGLRMRIGLDWDCGCDGSPAEAGGS